MKNKFNKMCQLALVMVACLVATLSFTSVAEAASQYGVDSTYNPSGVIHDPVLTNRSATLIAGLINTNFVNVYASRILPVPADGRFGFWIQTGATNALTVTNCSCTFQGIMFDSNLRTNVVDNQTLTVTVPTSATAAYDLVTNFPTVLSDNRTFAGWDGIRVLSCTNVNSESIWVSNFFQLRPTVRVGISP